MRTFDELLTAALSTDQDELRVTPEEECAIKTHPDVLRYLSLQPPDFIDATFCGRKLVVNYE